MKWPELIAVFVFGILIGIVGLILWEGWMGLQWF
jgi:hypothetical protein